MGFRYLKLYKHKILGICYKVKSENECKMAKEYRKDYHHPLRRNTIEHDAARTTNKKNGTQKEMKEI